MRKSFRHIGKVAHTTATGGQKERCAEVSGINVKTLYDRLPAYQGARRYHWPSAEREHR